VLWIQEAVERAEAETAKVRREEAASRRILEDTLNREQSRVAGLSSELAVSQVQYPLSSQQPGVLCFDLYSGRICVCG